jgi:RNA polymerase sigma-70 factor (ECF subfamily)
MQSPNVNRDREDERASTQDLEIEAKLWEEAYRSENEITPTQLFPGDLQLICGDHDDKRWIELLCLRIFKTVIRLLNHEEDAEDCMQEVLVRVFRNLQRFEDRGDGSFEAWVMSIAKNLANDTLRSRKRKRKQISLDSEGCDGDGSSLGSRIPGNVLAPILNDCISEALTEIREAIRTVDKHKVDVMHLTYIEHMNDLEIAGLLIIPLGTVHSRRYHRKKKVTKQLGYSEWEELILKYGKHGIAESTED